LRVLVSSKLFGRDHQGQLSDAARRDMGVALATGRTRQRRSDNRLQNLSRKGARSMARMRSVANDD
jgi:hypothetical protein